MVEFEWTDAESAQNFARHGVRFSEAVHAFLDPKAVEFADERRQIFSLTGHTVQGLLYVVFSETPEGRLNIRHARYADRSEPVPLEFDFDPRRMKRIRRPDRHHATPADVSPRRCRVHLDLAVDAELAAAYRNRPGRVTELLREGLEGKSLERLRAQVSDRPVLTPLRNRTH